MTAQLIDGRQVAAGIRERLATEVADFVRRTGRAPGLATLLVGDDPASEVYVANKRRSAASVGITDHHQRLRSQATETELADAISALAEDPAVSGILLQLPLPRHLNGQRMIELIPANKDVDGLTSASAGLLSLGLPGLRPCTPTGVMTLLDSVSANLDGALAVVIGRSTLVGRPLSQLLVQRDATVVIAHSHTRDLASLTRQADVVVSAAGVAGLITRSHVKPGATVIDVGIHRTAAGLTGDVRFPEVSQVAGWITPVPGGVGPMTIATLLQNTLVAAELQARGALTP